MSVFAETFWTPYEERNVADRIGQRFTVLNQKNPSTYDFEEVGVIYIIRFDDGEVVEAFPEEVVLEEQERNGKLEYPNGMYTNGKANF